MKNMGLETFARQGSQQENFVVRQATAMDLSEIVSLDRTVWDDPETSDGTHAWRLWIDYALVFVARDNEKLVGVLLAFPAMRRPDMYLLHKLFVEKDAENRGIAKTLIQRLFKALNQFYPPGGDKKTQTFSIRLTVSPENDTAKKLYRRWGFCELWTEPDYYGHGETRTIMEWFVEDSPPMEPF